MFAMPVHKHTHERAHERRHRRHPASRGHYLPTSQLSVHYNSASGGERFSRVAHSRQPATRYDKVLGPPDSINERVECDTFALVDVAGSYRMRYKTRYRDITTTYWDYMQFKSTKITYVLILLQTAKESPQHQLLEFSKFLLVLLESSIVQGSLS